MSYASTAIAQDPRRAHRPTCLLLTNDGIYWPLADYFLQRNLSLSAERAYARSISRLMNWTYAKHPDFQAGGARDASLFSSFLNDLLYGTFRENDEDTSGLRWEARSPDVVKRSAGHIAEFTDWLAYESQGLAVNPNDRPASVFERMVAAKAFQRRKTASLLAHTKSAEAAQGLSSMARRVNSPGKPHAMLSAPPAFPADKINELLWVGFQNERFKNDPRKWKRWNLRDILITLLCLYGGARVSEPMHLWIDDVVESDTDPLSCRALIHEPEHGKAIWEHPILGRTAMSRAEYLRQRCGKVPLTRARGARRSGWKGGLLTCPKRRAMEIIWIDPAAGRLFKELWEIYIQNERPMTDAAPWAFLTKAGLPMGPTAYADSLRRAVEKIGLPSEKYAGTTPHGLRHRYGQWLNDKGVSDKAGQICLHHANPMSQQVYRQVTLEQVASEMAATSARINAPALALEAP
ncbi:gamma-mobile-trio recombinase GmtY [Pseudoduganella aquatica]|uniref:Tyrosine-type recombinase/integrase n=1 Tax=Pseudoduganella aquatica TaxID=2660641 RepID=A0A7X4HJC4_9BURK|nr:gamma-mobile-trio recombinase GmtY [Pseudoduganella aquatica]MYN11240.1 tyrosine-type recombinase/integrase [Pseudoduganella aquatica]